MKNRLEKGGEKRRGFPKENVEIERASISACGIANYKLAADHWQLPGLCFGGRGV